MKLKIRPTRLQGKIKAISSKSAAHRMLICAAFANKQTTLTCNVKSVDILATVNCLNSLGANIIDEDDKLIVNPIIKLNENATLDCKESGSTLRFLLPIVAALGVGATLKMSGRLPSRPLSPLYELLQENGCVLSRPTDDTLKITGKLGSGDYSIAGNISSQYITGLLFALSLLKEKSSLKLTGKIESKPYIDLTLDSLNKFGINLEFKDETFFTTGNETFISNSDFEIEGDWSNSAFWACAGALSKKGIEITGLDLNSTQGDKQVLEILKQMGAEVQADEEKVFVKQGGLKGTKIDASNIPDLVPVLAVVAAFADGETLFYNAKRLRIKESDRIKTTAIMLENVGITVKTTQDSITVIGGKVTRGVIDSFNDHRIAMSTAVLSSCANDQIILKDALAVNKSYPHFYKDFEMLGGLATEVN